MNNKQIEQFNDMYNSLEDISRFISLNRLYKNSEKSYWLEYDEALEMSYENIIR